MVDVSRLSDLMNHDYLFDGENGRCDVCFSRWLSDDFDWIGLAGLGYTNAIKYLLDDGEHEVDRLLFLRRWPKWFRNRLPEEFDYQPNSAQDQGQHLERSALVLPFGGAPFPFQEPVYGDPIPE